MDLAFPPEIVPEDGARLVQLLTDGGELQEFTLRLSNTVYRDELEVKQKFSFSQELSQGDTETKSVLENEHKSSRALFYWHELSDIWKAANCLDQGFLWSLLDDNGELPANQEIEFLQRMVR